MDEKLTITCLPEYVVIWMCADMWLGDVLSLLSTCRHMRRMRAARDMWTWRAEHRYGLAYARRLSQLYAMQVPHPPPRYDHMFCHMPFVGAAEWSGVHHAQTEKDFVVGLLGNMPHKCTSGHEVHFVRCPPAKKGRAAFLLATIGYFTTQRPVEVTCITAAHDVTAIRQRFLDGMNFDTNLPPPIRTKSVHLNLRFDTFSANLRGWNPDVIIIDCVHACPPQFLLETLVPAWVSRMGRTFFLLGTDEADIAPTPLFASYGRCVTLE